MGLEIKSEATVPSYEPPAVDSYPAKEELEPVQSTADMQPVVAPSNETVEAEQPVPDGDLEVASAEKNDVVEEKKGDDADTEPPSPDQPINHTTQRPALMPARKVSAAVDIYRQTSFNMPIGTVYVAQQHAGKGMSQDVAEAVQFFPPEGVGLEAINREGADWQQAIQHGGRYIAPVTAMPKVSPGQVVSGDAAVALLKRHTGLGVPMKVELPGSCIFLEVNSIPDSEIINFHFAFATDRIKLGRDSAGMLLSARSGVYVERLVRLILSHVTWTNVKNLSDGGLVESLIRRIDNTDYSLLINAVMGAQWPDGFPWTIRCHHPDCGHEEPRSLSFPRMHYIDRSMLTEKQLDMLVKNSQAITDEELKIYRDEFKTLPSSRIVMEDGVVIELGRTTMQQYFQNTAEWISSIETQHNRSLTDYATAAERDNYMRGQQQAQALRRYRHFVKRVLIPAKDEPITDDDYYIIEDEVTITRQLVALSTSDARAAEFEGAVLRFIEDSTVGLVAYATETCPVCKRLPVNEKGEVINTLVPMAVDKLFFTVSKLKTQLLAEIDQQLEK